MRSKYIIPLIFLSAALCLLAGCLPTGKALETPAPAGGHTAGLLLSQDQADPENELDGVFTTWRAQWDLDKGTLAMEEAPAMVTTGSDRYANLFSWDGADQYIVWDETLLSDTAAGAALVPYRPLIENDSQVLFGPGYQVSLSPAFQCQVTLEGNNPLSFPDISPALTHQGKAVSLGDLSLLSHSLEGNTLTLVYGSLGDGSGENGYLLTGRLDLETQKAAWGQPVPVPGDYYAGLFLASSTYHPILEGRMYLSVWSSVGYYDLAQETFSALQDLPAQADQLLPQAQRAAFQGRTLPAEVLGMTQEAVIVSFSYREGETPHEVYAALQGDQALGFLDWSQTKTGSRISLYDAQGNKTQQTDVPKVNSAPRFQTTLSPT